MIDLHRLDVRTFMYVLFLGNMFFVLGYGLYCRLRLAELHDKLFVFGKIVQALAWGIMSMHVGWGENFAIMSGSGILLLGVSLEAWSFMEFQNVSGTRIGLYYMAVVFVGLAVWLEPFSGQPMNFKMLLLSISGAYVLFVPGFFFVEEKGGGMLKKLVGSLYLLLSCCALLKGCHVFFYPQYRPFEAGITQILLYTTLVFAMGATVTAFILLKNEDLHHALNQAVDTDYLTTTYNRKGFYDIASKYMEKAFRMHESVAVLALSVNELRLINDTHGHERGDRVLLHLADTLYEVLRKYDLPCRHGGNEFVVCLPNTSRDHVYTIADRIHARVKTTSRKDASAAGYTLSLGACCGIPSTNNDLDRFVTKSIQALDEAKRAGIKAVVVLEPGIVEDPDLSEAARDELTTASA